MKKQLHRNRKVKIVATLGPASDTKLEIRKMFLAGADIFRLNMSHGDHSAVGRRHNILRELEKEFSRPICILADLQGPKLRCGDFKGAKSTLEAGQKFCFDLIERLGNKERVYLPHPKIFQSVKKGDKLLIDDGKVAMQVSKASEKKIECTVLNDGIISDKKGVNCPDSVLDLAPLTEKDKQDLEFVCGLGVDWIGLSFVQRAKDVDNVKKLLKGRAGIIAKIEKPAAVRVFDSIIDSADGIMVARGDLGVEHGQGLRGGHVGGQHPVGGADVPHAREGVAGGSHDKRQGGALDDLVVFHAGHLRWAVGSNGALLSNSPRYRRGRGRIIRR